MFHPKWQKNPSAWWVICGIFQPRMQCSRQKIQELRQMLQHELVHGPVGEISFRRSVSPVEFIGMSPKENLTCVSFVWDLCGEVWWKATDYLGPKRFGNRSNFVPRILGSSLFFDANSREKGTSSGGQALQCVAWKVDEPSFICPIQLQSRLGFTFLPRHSGA